MTPSKPDGAPGKKIAPVVRRAPLSDVQSGQDYVSSPDLIFGEASLDQLVEGLMNAMKWHRRKADGGKCVLHQLHGFRFRVVAEEFRQKLKKKYLKKMASLFKFCRQKILLPFLTLIRITHSFICW